MSNTYKCVYADEGQGNQGHQVVESPLCFKKQCPEGHLHDATYAEYTLLVHRLKHL